MRLADFILSNVEPILAEWEAFARDLAPGSGMNVIALRDHAEDILRATARDMVSPQSAQQQSSKSKGHGEASDPGDRLDHASTDHAIERLESGFNLIDVVSEYRALRASVLKLWSETVREADRTDLEDLTRFNESIDQSLSEAVRSYTSRVDESRELFLAMLGHDLRAPLNAIKLSAHLLASSGQLDEEHGGIAGRVSGFVNTMSAMIHDLLDFTRTRLGNGVPVTPAPMDLGAVCREVLDECSAVHTDRDVRFVSEGDVRGEWDAARLRQVLSNLVGNALAHGDGRGAIDVVAHSSDTEVLLTVRNDGPELAASSLPTLFEPFKRGAADPNGKDRKGLGLGLFISRAIVIAHGGTISIASSEASGTTVSVRLPRRCDASSNSPS